jgi:hypothetical protein
MSDPVTSGLMWRQCVCGSWYWGAPQTEDDARLAESRPSDRLAAARFVATHWRDAYLEQHRIDPSGQWAIGTHPLSLVLAALDGERDPVHLGLPAEVHGAFRAALAEADSEPVMSVAMSDADEGPA